MKRIIKFRAYHNRAQKMLESGTNRQVFSWQDEGQDIVIMQFTGAYSAGEYDDVGKEIWEGDIIAVAHEDEEHGYYETFHEVVFEDSFFGIIHGGYAETLSELRMDKVRVAGNIYENPELLNS